MQNVELQSGIIYGPIRSRRLGWSLGLNVLPTSYKLCSFNCVYCQYGCTQVCTIDAAGRLDDFPTMEEFKKELEDALSKNRQIDNITFSGNGEPTLHPHFEELVDITKQLKREYFTMANIGVLSNSSMVSDNDVQRALAKLDFRIMKLDAGGEQTFRRINRACPGVDYQTIVSGLKSLDKVILQTMFVDGFVQNTGEREVNQWIAAVSEIQPIKAQIYSLHRPPAASSLVEVPAEKLREIAARTQKEIGVTVEVIVASRPFSKQYNDPYTKTGKA